MGCDMTKIIKLVFDGDRVAIEVDGVTGGSCKDATAAIESALGVASGSEFKPEFSMPEQLGEEQQQ